MSFSWFDRRADAGGHRHLGQRDREAAVGEVVDGGDEPVADQRADEVADALLVREVDRRGRAFLAPEDLAEIERLAEMRAPARRRAGEQDRLALGLEGERRALPPVVDQPDAADRRRRQDRLAVRLVVER